MQMAFKIQMMGVYIKLVRNLQVNNIRVMNDYEISHKTSSVSMFIMYFPCQITWKVWCNYNLIWKYLNRLSDADEAIHFRICLKREGINYTSHMLILSIPLQYNICILAKFMLYNLLWCLMRVYLSLVA